MLGDECRPAVARLPTVNTYDPTIYGERLAATYDDLPWTSVDTDGAVTLLADLAGEGPVLELGVGTGRLALPLAARGLQVHGIEASEAMVAQLRAKPDGDQIGVTIGDFTAVELPTRFELVFLAFNTLYALPTQEQQIRCIQNASQHLTPNGRFLVEAFVPDPARWRDGQLFKVTSVDEEGCLLEVGRHNPVTQHLTTARVHLTGSAGVSFHPANHRYVWPSELDVMARLAGLRLGERWGGWKREPFTSACTKHISAYQRPS